MADKEFSYGFGFKDIPKLLVIILGVSIICLFFPSKKAIDHQYGIGQKWEYDNVYTESPFTAVIQIQQDSIIESTVNYQAGSLVVAKGQFITNALNQTLDQFLPTTMDNSSILSGGWIYL